MPSTARRSHCAAASAAASATLPAFTARVSPKSSAWKMTFTAGLESKPSRRRLKADACSGCLQEIGQALAGRSDPEIETPEVFRHRNPPERLDPEQALGAER